MEKVSRKKYIILFFMVNKISLMPKKNAYFISLQGGCRVINMGILA